MEIPYRVYDRVLTNADRDSRTGCLISRYAAITGGYAGVTWSEAGVVSKIAAHLAVWRYRHGDVPRGQQVSQRCGRRKCVEEEHLTLIRDHIPNS